MTTNTTSEQRYAALYAAQQAERTAQLNLRAASINRAWHMMKAKHPDAILIFRVGDFYEIYGDDAIASADTLNLPPTRRNSAPDYPIMFTAFPHHALDTYLPKLVRAGFRVAITEEFADISAPTQTVWQGLDK